MSFDTLYAQDGQFVDTAGDTMTGPLVLPVGSNEAPAIQFAGSDDGIWLNGANISFVVDDGERWRIGGTNLYHSGNSGGALFSVALGYTNVAVGIRGATTDADTGIGSGAADSLSMIAGGVEGIRVTETDSAITTIMNGTIIHADTATPATAGATGTTGTIAWDADYIYVCTATDTWKRAAIATW